ncbi:MAG: AAA family ATPase [Lachnospiraceae bacterium]
MGTYFNPNNESFRCDKRSEIYIDKTGLLEFLNKKIGTNAKYISVSHARRFGKSHAAGMVDAYYSLGSDSEELFSDTEIATKDSFQEHLNKYNVIHLDISSVFDFHKEDLIEEIHRRISRELKEIYGDQLDYSSDLYLLFNDIYNIEGIPFVIIIDEWDCVIRNAADDQEFVHRYLQFLHSLFKSEESKKFLALAYITGILPIKKIQDESALNNFDEYTMVSSVPITQYYGFTEEEVKRLCEKYDMDFETTQAWYNGYLIDGMHMYNPSSVSRAMLKHRFDSYWRNTSSFESINVFIQMNFDGLKDDILKMLAGENADVEVGTFRNDLSDIASKDEALTALIHLGYLGYDAEDLSAYVPNYEVASAYNLALRKSGWSEVAKIISRCDEVLKATIRKDTEKVAEIIELAHETYTSVIKYNNENALSCVLTMAYFTAPAYYNIVREFPTGKGFADMVFIPRANAGSRPAMVIELKYDKTADTAIRQIKDKRYTGALAGYHDKILLVGINYEPDNKHHNCEIEEWEDGSF